jgi:hypothetical protein
MSRRGIAFFRLPVVIAAVAVAAILLRPHPTAAPCVTGAGSVSQVLVTEDGGIRFAYVADLRPGCVLRGAILRGGIYRGFDFRGIRFEKGDFRGAVLAGADFAGATFVGCDFDGADLAGVNLAGALYNAHYGRPTRWPRGFDPQEHGATTLDE